MSIDKEKMLKQVSAMIDEANQSEVKTEKTIAVLENRINLKSTIDHILAKESRNTGLRNICKAYANALIAGQHDELLYESFITNASNYSYLNAVDTELSALNERIKKYKQEIDLVKILRLMEQTTSYYIVPLIESCVVDYVQNKTPNNRAILRQALSSFQGDPYVKEINNVLNLDNSIPNNVYLGESFERANTTMHADTICSPVQYIKENESIFNVKGNYYVRKGNGITKLSKSNIAALPVEFKTLCEAINSPMVKFDMNTQSAEICDNTDYITVTNDGRLRYRNNYISESDFIDMANISYMMNEGRDAFWNTVKIIKDNISENIAVLDFVKHVELNESANKSVDVFRIKNNIFITTIDESAGKTTFYRNVNPIQAKKLINEHMALNVTSLFEDVLPNQQKIEKEVDETCKEYESYLQELCEKKDALCAMKEEDGQENLSEIEEAIKLVEDEIEKTKKDYKDYQESTKEYKENPESDEEDVDADAAAAIDPDTRSTEEVPDIEGDDSIEVEGQEDLETPVQQEVGDPAAESEEIPEFDSILDAPAAPMDNNGLNVNTGNDEDFQIVKVAYSKNVKTGKISNKGEVHMIIPSVDANGNLVQEMKKVTFYLTSDKTPVVNNDYMPYTMYNAILTAIQSAPETESAGLDAATDEFGAETPAVGGEAPTPTVTTDAPLTTGEPMVTTDTPDQLTISAEDDSFLDDVLIDPETFSEEPEPAEEPAPEPEDEPAPKFDDEFEDTPEDVPTEEASKEIVNVSKHYPIEVELSKESQYWKSCRLNTIERPLLAMLKDKGIEFNDNADGKIVINVKNKAEIFILKEFFAEWLDWTDDNFFNFFKEFSIAESVKITGINFINEEFLRDSDDDGSIVLDILQDSDLEEMLDNEGFKYSGPDEDGYITIETTDIDETEDLYYALKKFIDEYKYDLEDEAYEELANFMDCYAEEFEGLDNSGKNLEKFLEEHGGLELPYDDDLVAALEDADIYFEEQDDETIFVNIDNENPDAAKTLVDIIAEFNLGEYSSEVVDFMSASESYSGFVNESVKITVKDDKTGKTVEINTDDLNDAESDTPEENKEEDVTFNDDDTALFGDESDESEDEDKDEKDDEQQNEAEEEPKPKKVFKFRPKSKLHESQIISVNESADPNILDYVTYKGEQGQIISKYGNGDFIVNVKGSTIQCAPSEVKLVSEKKDTLKPTFKFDKATLKGLYENMMVRCGLFMNNVQLTPSDCFVNYGEYQSANATDNVRILLEGEQTNAEKQYIKLLEAVAINENDYVEGVEMTEDGKALRNVWINAAQYTAAAEEDPESLVEVILQDGTGTKTALPKSSLKTLSI